MNLQPRDAVHYDWMVSTLASHFPEGTETEPISCGLRGLWAAGKSISRGRENGGHRCIVARHPRLLVTSLPVILKPMMVLGYHTLAMCRQENDDTLRMELC